MKYRQYATYLITLVFTALFSCANPEGPTSSSFPVTIKGTVVNKNLTALDSVQIILENPNPSQRDSAKSDGTFLISFTSKETNPVNAVLRFSRSGFFDTTRSFTYSSTADTFNFKYVIMKGLTSAQDSIGPRRPSLRAGAIVYIGSSSPNLSIYGAGGTDVTTLTFEVRDSLGNPVDTSNQILVNFRFANTPPDSTPALSPTSVITNSSGRARVMLGSGPRAGIASVQAYAFVRQIDTTIYSPVVSIPIFGGFPDYDHFSLVTDKVNVPGAVLSGITTRITGLVGDKYGNPVQPGTVVYFGTTGGIVAPGSATTTEDGTVVSNLTTGNPFPPGGGIVTVTAQLSSGSGAASKAENASTDVVKLTKKSAAKKIQYSRAELAFRAKRAVVTAPAAKMVNDQKSVETSDAVKERKNKSASSSASGNFSRSVNVLFSGKGTITTSDTNFVIPSHGSGTIKFTVADQNGNPLTGGSTIQVSVSGSGSSDVEISGDLNKIIPDTQDKSFTKYQVTLKDKRGTGLTNNEGVNVKIDVASDNGNVSSTLAGKLLGSGVSDSVARVALVNPKIDSITVAGGGGVASQVIQFQVLDVNDKPTQNVPVQFEITKTVGGGEYFNPTVATTDVNGYAQTTLYAGIRSGIVQIIAKARKDTVVVASDPKTVYIRTGAIASIAIINVSASKLSVQGVGGVETSAIIFEGRDSLGNPIDASNSAPIKFSLQGDTTARVSPLVAKTDPVTGRVTTSYTSGVKSGVAYVTASAKSDSIKSSPVQIAISGGPADSLHFTVGPEKLNIAGAAFFGLTDKISVVVGDKYGNPAQEGTVVFFGTTGGIIQPSASTSADGKASVDLTASNPIPADGIAVITAQIGASSSAAARRGVIRATEDAQPIFVGKKGSVAAAPSTTFSRTTSVLFSGLTQISSPDTNFSIPANGVKTINYFVGDAKGNPLTEGTTIKVTSSGPASSDVEYSGNVDRTLPDVLIAGDGYTQFRILVRDKRTSNLSQTKELFFKIDVVGGGKNGNAYTFIGGRLLGTGSDSSSVGIGRIALLNTVPDSIVVTGGGGISSTQVQFKVFDVSDRPAKGIPVNFEFTKTANGGEYLSPVNTITDTSGIASVTIKSGIRSGTVQFVAKVKRDSLSTISSDPKTVYIRTGSIASIALISVSTQQLSVRSVGGTESATIVFEGRDSLGNALDFASQTSVNFKLQGDTTGIFISPNPAPTDPVTGRVIASFTSGTRAGVVQVYASAKNDSVKSLPVPFTIASGLPDQAHFDSYDLVLNVVTVNLPWARNYTAGFVVAAGDTFANPARFGTAVYLTTNAGNVDATGSLDKNGQAAVSWRYGLNPQPPDGIGYVASRSVNRWGKFVVDTFRVVISRKPVISSPDTNFTVAVGSTKQIDFTVSDSLLNPLSSGEEISVGSSGPGASDVAIFGDLDRVLPDTTDKAFTKFHVYVRDTRVTSVTKNEALNLTIDVHGPNGPGTFTLKGTLLGSGGGGIDSSIVGRIVLQNPTPESVVVAGIGGVKTNTAFFKVYNTFGLPAKNVLVTFSFSKSVSGGEYLSPTTAMTDTGGNVSTTLTSGTGFGEVRFVATAKRDSLTISSEAKVVFIVIPPTARLASQIAFLGATESDIFVAGVGSKENSTLTYEVRDSLGFPIDRNRRVGATFIVQFFPNTFAFSGTDTDPIVIPSTDSTDDQGKTRTTVVSGSRAGVIQVVVNIGLKNHTPPDTVLVSQPVRISVHAGFADQGHFTIAAQQINFPGIQKAYVRDKITVQVADKYSNPVLPGTAVYFNTSHGSIETGGGDAGLTDKDGFVSQDLMSANPFPYAPDTLSGMPQGFARVYARTIGKDNERVLDSLDILWTGAPIITKTAGVDSFTIANGSSVGPFKFTVVDLLGHPMSPGTSIVVQADAATISGDANISMPDTYFGGPGLTSFTINVADANPTLIAPVAASSVVTVIVTHPVYGVYKLVLGSGGIY